MALRASGENTAAISTASSYPVSSTAPHLAVRPFGREDVDGFVAYFNGLNEEECARMGIEPARITSPEKLRADVAAIIASPAPNTFILGWCIDGQVIGHSSLKDIMPGEFGTMHLH